MVGVRVLMEPILSLHYVAEIPLSLRYTPLKSNILQRSGAIGLVPLAPVPPTIHPLAPPGCYGLSYRSLCVVGSYLRVTLPWSRFLSITPSTYGSGSAHWSLGGLSICSLQAV